MSLMERHLPHFQFEEHHTLTVPGAPAQLLEAALAMVHEPDALINRLIGLRELPARLMGHLGRKTRLPARPFGIEDFTLLGRDGDREIAYGLVGRFWKPDYGLKRLQKSGDFDLIEDSPKLVLNFVATPSQYESCVLSTTTRVWCPDAASHRAFSPYWYLIRPVSGLIRKRLLKRIARHAHNLAV